MLGLAEESRAVLRLGLVRCRLVVKVCLAELRLAETEESGLGLRPKGQPKAREAVSQRFH